MPINRVSLRSFALLLALTPALALAAEPPVILDPQNGAVVPQTFPVTVDVGSYNYCDTDGCFDQPFELINIYADDEPAEGANPDGDEVVINVTLEPGTYNLVARGQAAVGAPAESQPVSVTVETGSTSEGTGSEGDPTAGAETESGDGETETSGDATDSGDSGDDGGGGCRVNGDGLRSLPLLLAAVLLLRRRRPARG